MNNHDLFNRTLTAKQAETLCEIVNYRLQTGHRPTQTNLAEALHLSVAAVYERLKGLRSFLVRQGPLVSVNSNHLIDRPDTARFLLYLVEGLHDQGGELSDARIAGIASKAGIRRKDVSSIFKMLLDEHYLSLIPARSDCYDVGTRTTSHRRYLELLAKWSKPPSKPRGSRR